MSRALSALLAAVVAVPLAAQQPLFRAAIEVVELDVSVTRGGRPVAGLTAGDFSLADNGVAQEIQSITFEKLPLSVTLVLDVSASVRGFRLAQLLGAANGLNDALRPDDDLAVIAFSHQIRLQVPKTGDRSAVARGLTGLTGVGSTAVRDVVHLAIQQPRHAGSKRPLVLLFSDGHDTSSWLTEADVIDSARRAASVVHIVRFGPDGFLDRLAAATGGRNWSASSESQLRELFGRALDEMRARYLITYSPRGVDTSGWHAVTVRLRNQRADVVARPGYFVP